LTLQKIKKLFDFQNGDKFLKAIQEAWEPPTSLTVSQWADRFRFLSAETSNESGLWRTSRTPYLKDIMDALSASSNLTHISVMKGAQLGLTETAINWIGYIVDVAPATSLFLMPSQGLINSVNEQKIDPLFKYCPSLKEKLILNKGKDKADTKRFKGGRIFLKTAGSAKNLSSISAKYIMIDEADRLLANVEGEGDPIALAETRASSFGADKKIFIPSTPTVKGQSIIEREFLAGDQRYFFLPCPHCGHKQTLEWDNLQYSKNEHDQIVDVSYKCSSCGGMIDEQKHKTQMLEHGEWIATAVPKSLTRASFHINSMYAPIGFYSWQEMAEEFEKSKDDENKLVQFYNTKLGLTYELQGDSPPWRVIYDQRENYELRVVPKDGLFLTAGVDTQPDRLEYEIVAWGKDKQSWSIDYGIIEGNPDEKEVWEKLEEVLNTDFKHELGSIMNISIMAIDTGGKNTQSVYNWCLTQRDVGYGRTGVSVFGVKNVMPIKGSGRHNEWIPAPNRITVNGKNNALRLWTLGVSEIKKEVYSSLKVEKPTDGESFRPRTCHFPINYDEEYFQQLTSEKQVLVNSRDGGIKVQWQKDPTVRNEALDVRVYARAAAHLFGLDDPSKNWKSLERLIKEKGNNKYTNKSKKTKKAQDILNKYKDGGRLL
tara:strand:- start:11097 stop:13061 length:1965 start_codon:yes stop_codon:yes gene_type:complete